MKLNLRALVLPGVFALATAFAVMPAHATLSGSEPRPAPGSLTSSSVTVATILAILGE